MIIINEDILNKVNNDKLTKQIKKEDVKLIFKDGTYVVVKKRGK